MRFKTTKIIAVICGLCTLLLTSGAYATWRYASESAVEKQVSFAVGLWRPNYPEEGNDQKALVDTILGEEYGLNGNSNTFINRQMSNREEDGRYTLGNMGFFNNLFGSFDDLYRDGGVAENVDFLIWYPDGTYDANTNPTATKYYIFTWEVKERNTGFLNNGLAKTLEGTEGDIVVRDVEMDQTNHKPYEPYLWVKSVYRTTTELVDGVWTETKVEAGSAPASLYQGDWGNGYITSNLAIYPGGWKATGATE